MIYANNGMLIPYQPRGTDTVPAMLTPGEFVVNRQATQQNLPLLKSINSGSYSSGGVVYAEEGAFIPWRNRSAQIQGEKANTARAERERRIRETEEARAEREREYREGKALRSGEYQNRGSVRPSAQMVPSQQQNQYQISPQMNQRVSTAAQAAFDPQHSGDINKQLAIFGTLLNGSNQVLTQFGMALENMIQGMGATPVGGGVNNNSRGQLDGLSQFTNTFNNFIGQLEKLNLPPQINIQGTHKVEVVINGASAFANMQEPIQRMILDQVNGAMNKLAMKTEGVLQV
jgi:hypothetical protein